VQKNDIRLCVRSIRHYLLNKDRPIYKILHKRRNNSISQYLQLLKVLWFQTTIRKRKVGPFIKSSSRIGLSFTLNQTKALLHCCDVILVFDRRALIYSENKKVTFLLILPSFYSVLFHWCLLKFRLSKTKYIKYVDIFSMLLGLKLDDINNFLMRSHKPVYVANLNNPGVFFIVSKYRGMVKFIHIPHSVIGNTVFPVASMVDCYYCHSKREFRIISKRCPATKLRLSNISRKYKYISSNPAVILFVLPKNWQDVQYHASLFRGTKEIYIKPHPATSFVEKNKIRLFFIFYSSSYSVRLVNEYKIKCSIYSVSSAAVMELIKLGKCVHLLKLKPGIKDHYDINKDLFIDIVDSPEAWKKQLNYVLTL